MRIVTSSDHEGGAHASESLIDLPVVRAPQRRRGGGGGIVERMRMLERAVSATVAEWRPDVVHAHSPVLVALPAFRASRRARVPFVYEVRDLWENASVDLGKFTERSLQYRMARALDTYVLRRADAVVAICETMRQHLETRTSVPVTVVGNGVDLASFQSGGDALLARRRWRLGDGPLVGYIGTFQPYEGLDLLVRAIGPVAAAVPGARLVIVGDGAMADTLKAIAIREGVEQLVTFTGRVPHAEVAHLYAAIDVLAYPRRLTRTTALTTPLKPLEAMAMGKAVVGSDVPAMAELIGDDARGVLHRAGDVAALTTALASVLADASLRERVGNTAASWVAGERGWCRLAQAYRSAYAPESSA